MITSFRGGYRFLSNFFRTRIYWCGRAYDSVEHAYQASKTMNTHTEEYIRQARTAGLAKYYGSPEQLTQCQPEWDSIRIPIMTALIAIKFARGSELARLLIDTDPIPLVEGNTWGDTFWGVCNGKGTNHLGRILMERRLFLVANLTQLS